MSDRLTELRRQRALVQEHLAWLEREIATTEKPSSTATSPNSLEPKAPLATAAANTAGTAIPAQSEAKVDEILAQYRSAPDAVRHDVRKGCLLYFGIALIVLVACVATLYFTLGPK